MATRLAAANRIADNGRMPVAYPPDADGYLPLKTSIVGRGILGAISYTRATPATVTDHEGVIRYCIAGEARFQGARRVQNLYTYSQDLSNAVWTAVSCAKQWNVTTAPDGTLTADRVQTNASTALMEMFQNLDVVSGKTYTYSAYVKYHNWRYIQLVGNGLAFGLGYINIDLQTGTITSTTAGAGNFSGTITSVGNGWYRVSATATCISTAAAQHLSIAFINNANDARIAPAIGDGTSGYYVWGLQMEDVTQQSIQTPGEYVSTNVLTGAPYHGSNVDGVKYFDTTLSGTQLSPDGYLAEGTKQNLFTDSEDFSLWTKAGTGVITPNATIAPDGRMTADLFTLSTANEGQSVNKTITTTASIYGYSVYVKPNGHYYVQLLASAGINSGYMNFDLLNGVVGTSSGYTGRVEALPNGWYRIKVTTPTVTAATGTFIIAPVPSASASRGGFVTGTGSSGMYIWGASLELGATSSYIPTTTTTVTRNIDVLTYDVRNALANQGAFSAVFTMDDDEIFDRRVLNFSGANNNRLQFQARRAGLPNANLFYGDGAAVRSVTSTQGVGTNNVAVAWTNGVSANVFLNNTKYFTGGTVPNLIFSTIDVGGGAGGLPIFGCIRDLRIWKTRPTDAELLLLSNNP